jgi:hypothetical protein
MTDEFRTPCDSEYVAAIGRAIFIFANYDWTWMKRFLQIALSLAVIVYIATVKSKDGLWHLLGHEE